MVEIGENLQAIFDNRMALAVLDVGNEANAARILFVAGVIQAVGSGKSGVAHHDVLLGGKGGG